MLFLSTAKLLEVVLDDERGTWSSKCPYAILREE